MSAQPTIRAGRSKIADDVEFGPDVLIEADEVEIKAGCRIGLSSADGFRTPHGVRITAQRLVLEDGVQIEPAVRIDGGEIRLDEGVAIRRHATIRVLDELHIGAHGTVGERCEISGRRVRIGQELWMLPGAKIGGGSAFERSSRLDAGHYLHLGVDTLVNTARPVTIGHEVGLGTRTSLYTHGAYPSRLQGFPVAFEGIEIGDFSWVPGAIINPGVRIGRCCVIGVNSLVTSSIADGTLAAGSPAKPIREGYYPKPLGGERLLDFFAEFLAHYAELLGLSGEPSRATDAVVLDDDSTTLVFAISPQAASAALAAHDAPRSLVVAEGAAALTPRDGRTLLDTRSRHVAGTADAASERLTNEMRRYGIRFYSRPRNGTYVDWEPHPPQFTPTTP
jgi:acetyltransferase-like isoleucine patch superfamily enzyme